MNLIFTESIDFFILPPLKKKISKFWILEHSELLIVLKEFIYKALK